MSQFTLKSFNWNNDYLLSLSVAAVSNRWTTQQWKKEAICCSFNLSTSREWKRESKWERWEKFVILCHATLDHDNEIIGCFKFVIIYLHGEKKAAYIFHWQTMSRNHYEAIDESASIFFSLFLILLFTTSPHTLPTINHPL